MLIQQDNRLRDITSTYLLTIPNGRFVLIDKSSALVVELFTSKTPYVAIDERGLVRSIHLFLFSCVH